MLKYDQKYITMDYECNALNLFYTKPWQLSWVEHHGTKLIEEVDLYIDIPNLNLSPFIKKLTGFNQKKYDDEKQPPKVIHDKLMEKLLDPSYKIIGQNLLGYDIYITAILQRICGVKPDYSYVERILDTMPLAKAYKHEIEKPQKDLIGWQFKILNDRSLKKRVNQKQLLTDFGIDFDEKLLHNSLYDVKMCKQVFDKLRLALNL